MMTFNEICNIILFSIMFLLFLFGIHLDLEDKKMSEKGLEELQQELSRAEHQIRELEFNIHNLLIVIRAMDKEHQAYKKEVQEIIDENKGLRNQPFLRIHKDYYIQYEYDETLFDMHKAGDIRSLVYLLNREHGFSEYQCENNKR